MEFHITSALGGVVVQMAGQFTFTDSKRFKEILQLVKDKVAALTLDFEQVSFIGSAGLGMLLLLRDECQNAGIPIAIRSAHGQVEKIFLLSKFDQLFSIPAKQN